MDYWNRDKEGNAVRTTDFNQFKTKNGRVVEDGGGVMPDIEIASAKSNALTKALIGNNVIFDFATDFYYKNTFNSIEDFKLSESHYNDFKTFANSKDFSFKTKTEKLLEETLNSDDSLLSSEVQDKYKELLFAVNRGKFAALDTYKKEISKKIEDEIIKRYFYRDGLYDYNLKNDDTILTAVELFKKEQKYNAILQ